MNNKQVSYISVWNKYLPAIRILLKKSTAEEQVLGMNRTDFERVAGIRKSGYRFSINYVDGRPDALYSGNDLVQAFITTLQTDEVSKQLIMQNNYAFSFSGKYQLSIKNNGSTKQILSAVSANDAMEIS